MSDPQRLVFGPFEFDLRDERLWCAADIIHLNPKAFAVLRCLLTQAGQLVTKDELFATVWPDTVVSEAVLATAIRELRRALDDRAHTPQYIETVYGRGYRFIASVRRAESAMARQTSAPPTRLVSLSALSPSGSLVGRESELAQLQQWLVAALQGERQVGFITGEAGIGKTALVDAFVDHVTATSDLWVSHGQCIEQYGAGEPYLPLLEALGRLCRGADGAHLLELLRQHAPSWLLHMPALLTSSERERLQRQDNGMTRERMLRELAEAMEVLTAEQPLVLVLEDLHWSDVSTLEWLSYVARRREPARVFILGTYRPVDVIVHTHPLRTVITELRQHGQCVERVLDYLSEAAVAAYLTQRFGTSGLPDGLARILHQRTNGNPFFFVTMVDDMIHQGVVTQQDTRWTFCGDLEAVAMGVPESVRHLIESQLAQLSAADREVLEAASIAGTEFAAAAVAAVLDGETEQVEAQCDALVRRGQFLRPRGVAEWPDRTVATRYRFLHDLYHEVVYAQVATTRRIRWHQQIGVRLEAGYDVQAREIAAELAEHFLRGKDTPRAVQYLRYAGDKALTRSANREAVACFEQALIALQHLPESRATREQAIDLHLALRLALAQLGEREQSLDHLRAAETRAEALHDQRRLGRISAAMTNALSGMGDYDRARAYGQRAHALATTLGDFRLQVEANFPLGQVYYILGEYRQAMDVLRWNVESLQGDLLQERTGTPGPTAAFSRARLVWCLAEVGAFAEGIVRSAEAIRIAEASDYPYCLVATHFAAGYLYLRKGDLPQAIPMFERGLGLCQDAHILSWFPTSVAVLGYGYALAGRAADAVPLLEQALERAAAGRTITFRAATVAWQSETALLVGRLDDALTLAGQALEMYRARKERGHEAWALRLLGDIAIQHQPLEVETAETHYRQALALAEALGMPPLQAHCHLGLGTLYATSGQPEPARAELSAAIALYRGMGMTFWLPQTEAVLAQVEGR